VPGARRRSLVELPCDHGDPGSMDNPNLREPELDVELQPRPAG
jgi:hypothetical protein